MAARVTKDNFTEKVLKNTLPVIVEFYSDSCIACKKLAPVLGDLEDNYEGKLEVVKVNTNYDAELSEEYGVMANPTIIIFKNGTPVDVKAGAVSYSEIEEWVKNIL